MHKQRFSKGNTSERRQRHNVVAALSLALVFNISSVEARELAKEGGVTIATRGEAKCAPTIHILVDSDRLDLFEDRLSTLKKLFKAAVDELQSNCQKLDEIYVKGRVLKKEVFFAKANATKNWDLVLLPAPLESIANEAGKKPFTVSKLIELERAYRPLSTLDGIENTFQYLYFMGYVNKAASPLVTRDNGAALKAYLTDMQTNKKSVPAIQKEKQALLTAIAALTPALEAQARAALDAQSADLLGADWEAFLGPLLSEGDIHEGVLGQVAKKANDDGLSGPLAAAIDGRVNAWLLEEIDIYEALLSEGYAVDLQEKYALRDALARDPLPPSLPQTSASAAQAIERLNREVPAALATLSTAAEAIIAETGESYLDVPEIWETGVALSTEFGDAGFAAEAKKLSQSGAARVEAVIAEGKTALRQGLQDASMSRETIAAFRAQADGLGTLSEDFPGFAAYVGIIYDGIAEGRMRYCAAQAAAAVPHGAYLEHMLETASGPVSIGEFACAIYQNDHILRQYEPGDGRKPALLVIDRADAGIIEFELSFQEETSTLIGRMQRGDQDVRLDEDAWLDLTDVLMTVAPSGAPDALGVTACDRLAADPFDPDKVADGVTLEAVPDDYDFDHAIDACIAAVEFAPDVARFRYQLARLLYAVGMESDATAQAKTAADSGYAPAIFLLAQLRFLVAGDDAFYDGIDLLKESAKTRYKPAQQMLADLAPTGSEIFRPIAPPKASDVKALLKEESCQIEGLTRMCYYIRWVQVGSCFQETENSFSCEISWGGHVRGAFGSTAEYSEKDFAKISKINDGSWRIYAN